MDKLKPPPTLLEGIKYSDCNEQITNTPHLLYFNNLVMAIHISKTQEE